MIVLIAIVVAVVLYASGACTYRAVPGDNVPPGTGLVVFLLCGAAAVVLIVGYGQRLGFIH